MRQVHQAIPTEVYREALSNYGMSSDQLLTKKGATNRIPYSLTIVRSYKCSIYEYRIPLLVTHIKC